MTYKPIKKKRSSISVSPNLVDYTKKRASFCWEDESKQLEGLPENQGLNIAHEAVDRHANSHRRNHVALRCLGPTGEQQDISYGRLQQLTNRFANVLVNLGVQKNDRVFVLAPHIPNIFITALGTLKNRSVFCALFSAYGPKPVHSRLSIGSARILVTTESLYQRKIKQIRESLPGLKHILIIRESGDSRMIPDTLDFDQLMDAADDQFKIPPTDPEDMALLHFTSGTTGKPKGAVHVHAAALMYLSSGRLALDLHPGDIFWCTADPGWVTGISYGMMAPLIIGATLIVDRQGFDASHWYQILQDQRVTVWYTAPTAVRMMKNLGKEIIKRYNISSLRFMASVGEPLNPDLVCWSQEAFGVPIHDNWWQTETGGIMISNYLSMDIKPGSMGKPLPGIEAAIVCKGKNNHIEIIAQPNNQGELALQPDWPSMFRGYLDEDERYNECFIDGWYLTGDLVKCDEDGYFWFIGRVDDVIKSSGHLISPFEVESALMEHAAIAESGVIGKPDPVAMEIVKAFVTLKPGYKPSKSLQQELIGYARKQLGAAVAPKEITFCTTLPRTQSGKIMRRLLKQQEIENTNIAS
ncbi:MAG: acetate--CoA ligase [bacterium]|nr:acetate--CoA ligase [bacterium]